MTTKKTKKPNRNMPHAWSAATKIASGVFGWDSGERRSNRYGSIQIRSSPYDGNVVATATFNRKAMDALTGKRVRLACSVVETRASGHIGDAFLKIKPSTPTVGDVIELGVGVLFVADGYDGLPEIGLMPEDGRRELWIDPRQLYRLHDQTVDLYAEETQDRCSPVPDLSSEATDGAIDNGDGTMQVKTRGMPHGAVQVQANVERLGDGLFCVTPSGAGVAGTRHNIRRA